MVAFATERGGAGLPGLGVAAYLPEAIARAERWLARTGDRTLRGPRGGRTTRVGSQRSRAAERYAM